MRINIEVVFNLISYLLLKKLWDVKTCSRKGLDRNSLDYESKFSLKNKG